MCGRMKRKRTGRAFSAHSGSLSELSLSDSGRNREEVGSGDMGGSKMETVKEKEARS